MKRFAPALTLALALTACTDSSSDAALRVDVRLGERLKSKCFKVTVQAPGLDEASAPIVIGAKLSFEVAVLKGSRPDLVNVGLAGFADEACTVATDPVEGAYPVAKTFSPGRITDVTLTLTRINPGTEKGHCANGVDDDEDGLIDCADPDCEQEACTSGNVCITAETCRFGVCMNGHAVTCATPPDRCHEAAGTCRQEGDAGCVYAAKPPQAPCDDGNACTVGDACQGDGHCEGAPKSCDPGTGCFAATGVCNPDGGTCQYAVRVGEACVGGGACTYDTTCTPAAQCEGPTYPKLDTACATALDVCVADGGRAMQPLAEGTACDGGLCNDQGACVSLFPYPASNFRPTQVPVPPAGGVTLNCGQTIVDTSAAGRPAVTNWCAGQPTFGYRALPQDGGPDAVLLSFNRLDVGPDAGLVLRGPSPVVLVSLGAVDVEGTVTVEPGTLACATGAGAEGGHVDSTRGGGGGGGFATAGGAGGAGSSVIIVTQGPAGAAGAVSGSAALVPLRGGCPGGRGSGNPADAGVGGGALQISAAGAINISGVVSAAGGAGKGGTPVPALVTMGSGANGGGAGGALLLEAPIVQLNGTGTLTANGGSGGEGAGPYTGGKDGVGGSPTSATPAAGPATFLFVGGPGGNGAAGVTGATAGGDGAAVSSAGGGGGGGGAGRIRVNAQQRFCVVLQGTVSPAATTGLVDAGCP